MGPAGPQGETGGTGEPGRDGVSPTIAIESITGGNRVAITDANGTHSFDVLDGASELLKIKGIVETTSELPRENVNVGDVYLVGTAGTYDYWICRKSTVEGSLSIAWINMGRLKGTDGVSPTVTVTTIEGGHRVTIIDAKGKKTFDVMDGKDGKDGEDGAGGSGGTVTPIQAMTSAVTPSEVFEALSQGAPVWVGHLDSTFGVVFFTNFTVLSMADVFIGSTIASLGGMTGAAALIGNVNTNEWEFTMIPMGVLVGTTATVTPTQVYDAIMSGQNIQITHTDSTFGVMTCTNFAIAESLGQVVFSTVVYYNSMPIALQLTGTMANNSWHFQTMPLVMADA
jgi:hypothetical protein